jgi:flagellar basal body-associated protein FliL
MLQLASEYPIKLDICLLRVILKDRMTHQKQQKHKKNSMGVLAAGVAGAVAIAGVAVAATLALKDENTREKVKKTLNDVTDQAREYVDKIKTEQNPEEVVEKVKKITTQTKKIVEKNT